MDSGLAADGADSDVVDQDWSLVEIETEFKLMSDMESFLVALFEGLALTSDHMIDHDGGVSTLIAEIQELLVD